MLRGELRGFFAKQLVPELQTRGASLPCDTNRYALSCAWPQLHIRVSATSVAYLRETGGPGVRR